MREIKAIWELSLNRWQTISVLIFICLLLTISYFLGFITGQSIGFDRAREESLAKLPRLPIIMNEKEIKDFDLEAQQAVFEKLKQPLAANVLPEDLKKNPDIDMPEIGPIATIEIGFENLKEQTPTVIAQSEIVQIITATATATVAVVAATPTLFQLATPTLTPSVEEIMIPTITPTQAESSASSGWYVQVAAPSSKVEAEKIASKLYQAGFKSRVDKASSGGDQFYRVLVGPEDSEKLADALLRQLVREPYIKGTPFIRRIK
ncbi:MAG TPA: SPOR domain-containing protein [Oligoflexia bacterium]|nr:SPOR domain-containing protein [Oligoflexia bacterium]HMP26550.1 SPOR domain-containing protein [Oligoflexia bacterium]